MLTDEELCADLRTRWEAELADLVPTAHLLTRVRNRHAQAWRRRWFAAAGTTVAIAGSIVTLAAVAGSPSRDSVQVGPATGPSSSTSPRAQLDPPLTPRDSAAIASGAVTFGPPPSSFVIYHAPGDIGTPSERLLQVQLPHPAPEFPARLQRDRVDNATTLLSEQFAVPASAWVATFTLGTHPDKTQRDRSGAILLRPTGPSASVTVIDAAVPLQPDAQNRILGDPVVSTTQINGQTAFVTQGSGSHLGLQLGAVGMYFTTSHFTIMIVSDSVAADSTLAHALTGI